MWRKEPEASWRSVKNPITSLSYLVSKSNSWKQNSTFASAAETYEEMEGVKRRTQHIQLDKLLFLLLWGQTSEWKQSPGWRDARGHSSDHAVLCTQVLNGIKLVWIKSYKNRPFTKKRIYNDSSVAEMIWFYIFFLKHNCKTNKKKTFHSFKTRVTCHDAVFGTETVATQ